MIWAQDATRGIGKDGVMPWHLPEDYAHFRETTSGATVIMGRITWESLPGKFRPLPERQNIVITHHTDDDYGKQVCETGAKTMDFATLEHYILENKTEKIFIIGGGAIYKALMDYADELIISEIDAEFDTDTNAPTIPADFALKSAGEWQVSRTLKDGMPLKWRIVRYAK